MKDYLGAQVDLTGDPRINPGTLDFGDNEGSHGRAVGSITSFSVHHDAQFRPHDYDSVARYVQQAAERADLGPGLPYNYRIDNTGVIFVCRPLTTWLNSVGSSENPTQVSICLDGNFEPNVPGVPEQLPTLEQCEAFFQLIQYLCTQRPDIPTTWPDVRPHASYSATACCGLHFRDYVYAIKDEPTAAAFPANTGYDWPEYQPGYVAPQPTTTTTTQAPPLTATTTAPPAAPEPGPGPEATTTSTTAAPSPLPGQPGKTVTLPVSTPPTTTVTTPLEVKIQEIVRDELHQLGLDATSTGAQKFYIALLGAAIQVLTITLGASNPITTTVVALATALGVYAVHNTIK